MNYENCSIVPLTKFATSENDIFYKVAVLYAKTGLFKDAYDPEVQRL